MAHYEYRQCREWLFHRPQSLVQLETGNIWWNEHLSLTEHDSSQAVVGIEKGDLDLTTRIQLDGCGGLQRQRFLCDELEGRKRTRGGIAYQDFGEMFVCLLPRFKQAICVVDPTWIPLKSKQNLSRCCRTINTELWSAGYKRKEEKHEQWRSQTVQSC